MFFHAAGKVNVLAVVTIRLKLGVNRTQMLLFLEHSPNVFLKVAPADPSGAVRFDISGNQAANHFRRLVGGFEYPGHQLTVFPCGRTKLIHYNTLHRAPGFPGQPFLHGTEGELGGDNNTHPHGQQQCNHQGVEFYAQRELFHVHRNLFL